MKKFLALMLCLLSSGAFAQSAVRQSGSITPFDVMRWRGTSIADDPQNDSVSGRGVNPFSIYDAGAAEGLCFKDALTTTGAYHKFCFGHNAAGDAKITIDAVGAVAAGCSISLNGTSYSCVGGGGNVSGPGSSTDNEPVLWNGTSGNTIKNALNTVIAHTGGVTGTDTTVPTSFSAMPAAGYSGFVWKTPNLLQLTQTATHAGQFHSAAAILNTTTGSGANGPSNDDMALTLGCNKASYLTSAVEGEIGCLWAFMTQGAKGDAAAYLTAIEKVDDPAIPNYSGIMFEGATDLVTPTTGVVKRGVHNVVGWGLTGFQDISGVAIGGGSKCRLTVPTTASLSVVFPVTVYGIVGAPECNGNWAFTIVDGTHIELTNSVLVGVYSSGGVVGNPSGNIGGPTFGYEARSQTGNNGVGFLASHASTSTFWGSPFRGRHEDDSHVYFDMDVYGHMILQPPTQGTALDTNYVATLLAGNGEAGLRWTGNTVTMPRDNPQYPGTLAPGGGALGHNFSAGSGEVDLWNLLTTAVCTLNVYQKTAAATQTLKFQVCDAGSEIATPFNVSGGGMTIGVPTGGYKGTGSVNFAGTLWSDGTQGIATCSVVTAGATITIKNGIITGFTGC